MSLYTIRDLASIIDRDMVRRNTKLSRVYFLSQCE